MENVVISLLRNPGLKRTLKATKFQKNIQTRRVTSKMEQSPIHGHNDNPEPASVWLCGREQQRDDGVGDGREKVRRRSGSSGFNE